MRRRLRASATARTRTRGTIDPFKEAALFKSELEFMNQKEIADKYLVDPSTVSHRLSLLRLVPEVVEQVSKLPRGTVTPSHLEPIATLPEGEQKSIKITSQAWNGNRWGDAVRTVEDLTEEAKRVKEKLAKKEALRKALMGAQFGKCPTCGQEPKEISYKGLPWVECSSGHYDHQWNIETGKAAYKQETYSNQDLDGKKSEPVRTSVLRCAHTTKELSQTFEQRIKETLSKLAKIEHLQVRGSLRMQRH
jgi:hypothetical protein